MVLGLLLNGCTPDPENFIGMPSSSIKVLVVLFIICGVIVLIFLGTMYHLEKKKYSFGFFDGLSFLIGPGLITTICYIVMVVSGFLIISFFSNIIIIIAILMGIAVFVVEYTQNKKK